MSRVNAQSMLMTALTYSYSVVSWSNKFNTKLKHQHLQKAASFVDGRKEKCLLSVRGGRGKHCESETERDRAEIERRDNNREVGAPWQIMSNG